MTGRHLPPSPEEHLYQSSLVYPIGEKHHACRVPISLARKQGHLAAMNFCIPKKRRPVDTNSEAGITLDESTGVVLKKAVTPGADWLIFRVLVKTLYSSFPYGSLIPHGGVVSRK